MAFIVEVKPDWNLAPGDPGSDVWQPGMPAAAAVFARDVESLFELQAAAQGFQQCLRSQAGSLGVTFNSADYELRVREVTLLQFFQNRA